MGKTMRIKKIIGKFLLLFLFITVVQQAGAEDSSATDTDSLETASLETISRKLENPLTTLWALSFQNNTDIKRGDLIDGTEVSNTLLFQPFIPLSVGENKDMVLSIRPVFPLVTAPVLDSTQRDGVNGHDTGLGDIQMLAILGPNVEDGWIWGIGSTFKFPTATEDTLGQEKYQAGPAAMLFNLEKPWTYGALVQHWWSYAGDDDREETSQTDIQYTIRYSLPDAWSIGMGPTVSIDWKEDHDNQYTVPVGLGLTKTVRWGKVPVKLRWELHYSVIRPEDYGNEWTFRFQVTPVIKNPFL